MRFAAASSPLGLLAGRGKHCPRGPLAHTRVRRRRCADGLTLMHTRLHLSEIKFRVHGTVPIAKGPKELNDRGILNFETHTKSEGSDGHFIPSTPCGPGRLLFNAIATSYTINHSLPSITGTSVNVATANQFI
ncbi:uncharacterized protein FOMMEDRAFT_158519 [Fomitiporia mediterranea MF3/22]|uniref:uncharacterized protein n=1 Tax=Fomitiporia mediterranea (strain MF3/22) TaxID=694068 RepID=UPI0004408494|nr:uncharacterized protein FOMMEDRAFT_158519 [Fomitiporia mediterranea MF3/22]EJD01381.1 hypothetical protein FOMMEDRAFT_158519 [Fomitiporia mediterranea MF3/22]